MANKEDKLVIIRTDLFTDEKSLQATLADWETRGLDIKKEIDKMIKLGYIRQA